MVVEVGFEPHGADAGRGDAEVAGETVPALGIQAESRLVAAGVRAPGRGPRVGERRQRRAGQVDDRRVDEHAESGVECGERRGEGIVVGERQVDPAAGRRQIVAA